jgi:hypothetical protein
MTIPPDVPGQSIPNQIIGWLKFIYLEPSDSGKTEVWAVCHKDIGEELGEIYWNVKWRQYWFEAADECGFTRGCLRDIATFIDKLMEAHDG